MTAVKDAMLYVIYRGIRGKTHLHKAIWFAEVESYTERRERITDALFIRQKYGPMISTFDRDIEALKKNGFISESQDDDDGYTPVNYQSHVTEPLIRDADKKYIDEVLGWVNSSTAKYLSDLTHTRYYSLWEHLKDGDPMPVEAVVDNTIPPTPTQLQWAEKILRDFNSKYGTATDKLVELRL